MKVLDLRFQGAERVIASFLLDSGEGPVLVETGPESCYPRLVEALRAEGVAPEEVRHVFVTHIHLDHAGAAWRLAELGATVYVHPRGAPHLVDPSRLLASAERIYGDQLKALWCEVRGSPEVRVRLLADGEVVALGGLEVQAVETPGHASHHHAYRVGDLVFTGDVAGVRIAPGPVLPPTPPPDIHLGSLLGPPPLLKAQGPLPHPLRGLRGRGGPPPGAQGGPGGLGGLGASPPEGGAFRGGDGPAL